MHAYFLLPGDPKVPIIYDVDRIRDGKSFTTRRVTARQHGHPIFSMLVSFHTDEPGLEHQAKMPDVPPPESLPSEAEIREKILPTMPDPVRRYYERERPIELRPVEFERYRGKKYPDGKFHMWIKTPGRLPDDPAIHQCVLASASMPGCVGMPPARGGAPWFLDVHRIRFRRRWTRSGPGCRSRPRAEAIATTIARNRTPTP